LIEAAGFFELPETSTPPCGAADYVRYTISLTDGENSHTVHLSGPIEDPDIQVLVEYLEAKARDSPPAQ
jgi:Emfourin